MSEKTALLVIEMQNDLLWDKRREKFTYDTAARTVDSETRDGDKYRYAYFPDGTVQTMARYADGKQQGRYTVYYSNGNVRYTGVYDNGVKTGEWLFYNEDGSLSCTQNY